MVNFRRFPAIHLKYKIAAETVWHTGEFIHISCMLERIPFLYRFPEGCEIHNQKQKITNNEKDDDQLGNEI